MVHVAATHASRVCDAGRAVAAPRSGVPAVGQKPAPVEVSIFITLSWARNDMSWTTSCVNWFQDFIDLSGDSSDLGGDVEGPDHPGPSGDAGRKASTRARAPDCIPTRPVNLNIKVRRQGSWCETELAHPISSFSMRFVSSFCSTEFLGGWSAGPWHRWPPA